MDGLQIEDNKLGLKTQVTEVLTLVAEIKQFGVDAQNFAAEIESLISGYSDEKIKRLYDIFWNNLNPKTTLFQKETADKLYAAAPVAKELNETNKLLKLVPNVQG